MTTSNNSTAIIFAGGDTPVTQITQYLPTAQWIIAADSGLDHALRFGFTPNVVVGDLDSASHEGVQHAVANGVRFETFSADKDLTDTEIALDHAVSLGATRIILVSAGGGRLDHAHGLLAALFYPEWRHVRIEAFIDTAHVHVLHAHDTLRVHGEVGSLLALHAMNGPAHGIETTGLRWSLNDESLSPWASRGVSNELVDHTVTISLRTGALMVLQPEAISQRSHT